MNASENLDLIQKGFEVQRQANQEMLDSALDAGDRLQLRKASEAIVNLAQVVALIPDPTK